MPQFHSLGCSLLTVFQQLNLGCMQTYPRYDANQGLIHSSQSSVGKYHSGHYEPTLLNMRIGGNGNDKEVQLSSLSLSSGALKMIRKKTVILAQQILLLAGSAACGGRG